MPVEIPETLARSQRQTASGRRWLARLPQLIEHYAELWHLEPGTPFDEDLTGSWVAPCESPQGPSVLKIGFPHVEAAAEIDGLRAWGGGDAIALYQWQRADHALLLERCVPGDSLRGEPAETQDAVVAELLRSLWRTSPPDGVPSLADMIEQWCAGAERRYAQLEPSGSDKALVERGLTELKTLVHQVTETRLLATDLHAGNVLSSHRRPWLVIDPKPHVGDPTYDLTQHLLNHLPRLQDQLETTIARVAELAGVDDTRLLRWTFGRLCLDAENLAVARSLEPLL